MDRKSWILVILVSVLLILTGALMFMKEEKKDEKENHEEVITKADEEVAKNFTVNLIKKIHANNNYLISPYSIEIALNMLREGTNGNTKEEIDKVIGKRHINDLKIPNKLNIANAIFIKDYYQDKIKKSFTNTLVNQYNAEMLYDKFTTPDVINNWVNKKTNGMIPKVIDSIDSNFVMGLANAVALDIKWQKEFECNNTRSDKFTKLNGEQIDIEMMHDTYRGSDYKYINEANLKGVILPYKKEENSNNELEFIGLLPDNIDEFINTLDLDIIDKLSKEASDKVRIQLSLPRFTYSYDVKEFKEILYDLGIRDAFNETNADFTRVLDRKDMNNNLYVDTAIHKTKIELMESGTKAAAVTYFGIKANGMIPNDFESIDIAFNKPFIYLIREKNTKEILFFGMVNEPNLWKGMTCDN